MFGRKDPVWEPITWQGQCLEGKTFTGEATTFNGGQHVAGASFAETTRYENL